MSEILKPIVNERKGYGSKLGLVKKGWASRVLLGVPIWR